MKIPQGFARKREQRVCNLKSLYRLCQASQNWHQKFTNSLLAIGFTQSHVDHSLFISFAKESFVAVLIYVDDIIVTRNDALKICQLKTHLDSEFRIKDLGKLKYFLGIEVA